MRKLRFGMGQINSIVGDLEGNATRIIEYIAEAKAQGVELLAFPELALTGYPPEDLLLKPHFIADNLIWLDKIAQFVEGFTVVLGFVDSNQDIYNAAAILNNKQVAGVYHKMYLPTYGVFDEDRYFQAGKDSPIFVICGVPVGVNICEDIWYSTGPTSLQSKAGAELIVNINASPYHKGKLAFRERMLAARATDNGAIVAYVNTVGGQDELVFDGGSMVFDQKGELVARGNQFQEELIVVDLNIDAVSHTRLHDPRLRRERQVHKESGVHIEKIVVSNELSEKSLPPIPPKPARVQAYPEEVYSALVLGTRDYVRKNGFEKVVIGLSGGIDSSLTAVIAADALGVENVIGVGMPSRFSSVETKEDTMQLVENLDIEFLTVPIEPPFEGFLATLAESFEGTPWGIAEENLQARIRGTILMALSNKFGYLVLTTGNKSEMATGYSTLYGDMAGGLAVIKDVPKTMVYELARFRSGLGSNPLIPERIFTKEPTAELRPGQRDIDSLPPYAVLDPILQAYVEEDHSFNEIVAMGFDEETVRKIIRMVDRNEYKRRQAPPGIKVTPRAFGRDRRLPITNRYRSY